MAYEPKLDWVDDPDAGATKPGMTPIMADDMKRIEQGVDDAHDLAGSAAETAAWPKVTGKPSSFPAADHDHAIGDVTGLQSALDEKQKSGNYATTAQVNAKADQSALDALEARVAALEPEE